MRRVLLRWARFALGLAAAGCSLWLALRNVRIASLYSAMRHIQWAWILAALAALSGAYWARIFRWWWILRVADPTVTFRSCVGPLIASVAVNNVIPFRAGDALRITGFRSQLKAPLMRLFGSMLVERVLDLTTLLAILLVGIAGVERDRESPIYLRLATLAGIGLTVCWGLLVCMGDRMRDCLLRFLRWSNLHRWLGNFEASLKQLFAVLAIIRAPDHAVKLLAMSLLIWGAEGTVFSFVASGLQCDGRVFAPWFSLSTASLATLIPSTPGYVGTFDFFAALGLRSYGVSETPAVATAFVVHAVLWLPLTVAGLSYLQWFYLGVPRARHASEHTREHL